MSSNQNRSTTDELLHELVSISRDTLIVELALAGLTQHQIREIVGVDIHKVNRIAKHLKSKKGIGDG